MIWRMITADNKPGIFKYRKPRCSTGAVFNVTGYLLRDTQINVLMPVLDYVIFCTCILP